VGQILQSGLRRNIQPPLPAESLPQRSPFRRVREFVPAQRTATTPARRPLIAAAAALLLAAGCMAASLAWPGKAGSAPLIMTVLGKTVSTPPAGCPKNCEAPGNVSGFQSLAAGTVKPFMSPYEGKIISWSVSLGRPTARSFPEQNLINQKAFFDDLYGRPAQARISVLRLIEGSRPPTYRLVRHSPLQVLNPYFGHTVEFSLEHPLGVAPGDQVALTIPTWAPAFATNLDAGANAWRASRRGGDTCNITAEDLKGSKPHQKKGSKRRYACYYRGARLLYTATVVKKPRRARSTRAETRDSIGGGAAVGDAQPIG
jgi:hypothetical protein